MRMIRFRNISLISVMIMLRDTLGVISKVMLLILLTLLIRHGVTDESISLKDYLTYANRTELD